MEDSVRIRKAEPTDAEAIVQVHFAAVHQTAGPFYPADILVGWSRQPDEGRYQWIRKALSENDELFFVAEDQSGIIGFGAIVPGSSELRALYVHPQAGRRGIGKRILGELEREAVLRGVPVLSLNASLNAEPFYRRNGYEPIGPGTQRLATGQEMACVKMKKTL